jgi:hypothetical protein
MDVSKTGRPRGTSDIFDKSAWWPSLKRYIEGGTRDQRSNEDRKMIALVYRALRDRDELQLVHVSMLTGIKLQILTQIILS